MEDFNLVAPWLGTAVIGAIIAFLGFLGTKIVGIFENYRKEKTRQRASLVELNSLLNASYDIFCKQNELVQKLSAILLSKYELQIPEERSYESIISNAFSHFNKEEAELHAVIRGYTFSLKDINQDCLNWLRKDTVFKAANNSSNESRRKLADKLLELESHLYLWMGKYNAWIPGFPEHSLVYLADEAHHGKAFPKGIEDVLKKVINL